MHVQYSSPQYYYFGIFENLQPNDVFNMLKQESEVLFIADVA